MTTYFENIKQYVGFTEADTEKLRMLCGPAEAHLVRFSEHFYSRTLEHPDAMRVFEDEAQIERLKRTLVEWMRSGLQGPHDEAFYHRRARIGRVHVRISLPQEYMFTAMNVLRLDFHHLIDELFGDEDDTKRGIHDALDKLFDLELAIMLQTYQEDSEERLRRNERLATIGQIAASIGHDLRNPLSVMQSSLYIVRKRTDEDDRVMRHLNRIDAQIALCDDIIKNLLQLARNQPPRRSQIKFPDVFSQTLDGLSLPETIKTELNIAPGVELHADEGLLRQALANMVNNAVQAYERRPGTVYLAAWAEDDHVILEVADDGPGFDADTIVKAFEPLITTKITGTGLGLALVKGVTERHGGTVEALNRPEGGAAVRLRLPKNANIG